MKCVSALTRDSRTDGGKWTLQKCPYKYTACEEVDTREMWKEQLVSNSACMGEAGTSSQQRCLAAQKPCSKQTQTRKKQLTNDSAVNKKASWKSWDGGFKNAKCTEELKRTMWLDVVRSGDQNCTGELQKRTRSNAGTWGAWSGAKTSKGQPKYTAASCTQRQDRRMYRAEFGTKAEPCKSETQSRQRRSASSGSLMDTWSKWGGSFNLSDCVQAGWQCAPPPSP